jgi:hypothetical protein
MQATSPFVLDNFNPQEGVTVDGVTIGGVKIAKTFSGDVVGTGAVEMMAVHTASGPAVYVAIERVTASVKGRTGTFVFQHVGDATVTPRTLALTIVPGSGTGELKGIVGKGDIKIEGKAHTLILDYDFEPETAK